MKTVFINGMGLMGGSLAKVIKHGHPEIQIISADINEDHLDYMQRRNFIDQKVDFKTGALAADIIILATPVQTIIKDLYRLAKLPLKESVLVSDLGSSKQKILAAARPLMQKGIHFLGGHPMAGSHLVGSSNSDIDLFNHRTYFLVNGNAEWDEIQSFKTLFQTTTVSFQELLASEHDQLVSMISHLPHVIAFSLINTIQPELKQKRVSPQVAAGGLLDTTRIAMGDVDVWSSIINSNADLLIPQIERFESELDNFKQIIKKKDAKGLQQKISHANQERKAMERK